MQNQALPLISMNRPASLVAVHLMLLTCWLLLFLGCCSPDGSHLLAAALTCLPLTTRHGVLRCRPSDPWASDDEAPAGPSNASATAAAVPEDWEAEAEVEQSAASQMITPNRPNLGLGDKNVWSTLEVSSEGSGSDGETEAVGKACTSSTTRDEDGTGVTGFESHQVVSSDEGSGLIGETETEGECASSNTRDEHGTPDT